MKSILVLVLISVFTSHVSLANSGYSEAEPQVESSSSDVDAAESVPFCVPTPAECVYSCPKKTARWELNRKVCPDFLSPILCQCLYVD